MKRLCDPSPEHKAFLFLLFFDLTVFVISTSQLTLQVEQGAAVGGGVWRSLGDGQQEGSVSSQQAAHEAKERLLDLQLQLLLTPVDLIVVRQQELQRRLLLAGSANCSDKKDGETTAKPARFLIMKSRNSWSSFMCLYKCFKMEIKS